VTKALPFTASSLARAIKGAAKAGLKIIAINADGSLSIGENSEKSPALKTETVHPDPFVAGAKRLSDGAAARKRNRATS